MRTSPVLWILFWIVFVAGLVGAARLLTGWRRSVVAAGWGALCGIGAFALGFRAGGGYWTIPAGAMGGWLFITGWDFAANAIWRPWLRTILAPDHWDLAATQPPLTAQDRGDRTGLALSTASGASGVGLMAVCGFDKVCRDAAAKEDLAIYLVISVVAVWLSARFLEPIVEVIRRGAGSTPDPAGKAELSDRPTNLSGRNRIQLSILLFVVLVAGDVANDLFKQGLQTSDGAGVVTLLANSLVAGVVTYYWVAAISLHAPSVARQAAYTTTVIGALLSAPLAFVPALRVMVALEPSPYAGQYFLGQLIVMVLAAALTLLGISLFFGIVLFGLYAYGGGLALDRLRITPIALRVTVGLLPVATVYTLLLLLFAALLNVELMTANWVAQAAMVAGWALALLVDPRSQRALDRRRG